MQPNPYQSPKHPAQPSPPKGDSASYFQLMWYFVFPGIWLGLMTGALVILAVEGALVGLAVGFISALFFITVMPAILKLVGRMNTGKRK